LITFCSSQFIIKKTALWHPLERSFYEPSFVLGRLQNKTKTSAPPGIRTINSSGGKPIESFLKKYLPLQKFTRLDGM
jgi:hypothetical protein